MKKRTIAITTLIVAQFMDLVDTTITNVALPSIKKDLHATDAHLEWIMAGYLLAFAVLLITGGRLGDIYGRRTVFLIGVAGFGATSLWASAADTGQLLVAARVVQGAFAGVMVPQVLSSVQVMYEPAERGKIYGLIGAISALGSVVGLIAGGWMVGADLFGLGWRIVFLVNVPVCLLLLALAGFFVPNSRSEDPLKLDLLGVVLAASGVFLIEFPLIDGRMADWAPWIWGMLAAAPVMVIAFILQQRAKTRRDGSALLPLKLFSDHGFSSGLVVQILFWMANGGYMIALGYYLQIALGFSPLATGLTIFAMTVGSLLVTPAGAPLAKKFGKYVIFAGGLIQAAAFVWAIWAVHDQGKDLSGWDLAPALGLSGAGMVLLIVPLLDEALRSVPPASAGAASGVFTTFQQVGYSMGVAVAGVVFFNTAGDRPTFGTYNDAVTYGLWVTVAAFALSGLCALFMPKLRPHTDPATAGAQGRGQGQGAEAVASGR
ncbi:MFS transporter [Streptomyces sp. NPDC004542]|uniref:MFS transporter n=1 Tax=Streptomyces sp. NPDC004542 TaxID=3154281 RepID=UPI0033B5B7A4